MRAAGPTKTATRHLLRDLRTLARTAQDQQGHLYLGIDVDLTVPSKDPFCLSEGSCGGVASGTWLGLRGGSAWVRRGAPCRLRAGTVVIA